MTTKPYNNRYWLQKTAKNQKITKFFDNKHLFGRIFAVGYEQTIAPTVILWFVGSKNDDFLVIDISKLNFRLKKGIIWGVFNDYFEDLQKINDFLIQNGLKPYVQILSSRKIKQIIHFNPSDAKNILNF